MTVHRCQFLKFYRGEVKEMLFVVVLLTLMGNFLLNCNGQDVDRDARRLFGGYRITPTYCKASRAARYNRGNTICMFNHECAQRGGEVVGACMDGFLFGACCQLKSDSQSHIPKGPGVVIPGYEDYSESETEGDEYDNFDQLDTWHNSFKPVVTPGYRPSDKYSVFTATMPTAEPSFSTESVQAEIISEGLSQITNTLLNTPPKDNNLAYIKPEKLDTQITIDHAGADTILLHKNGSEVDDIVRPSDFNIQISSMQIKPTISPSTTFQSPPSFTMSTHKPIIKPIFKPKPVIKPTTKNPSTENYVMVSTVTKDTQKITELSSIDSIIQMLNESTPSMKEDLSQSATIDMMETKSSPITASTPVYHSSVYPINHITTGHYVTLKPSSYSTNEHISNSASATNKPSLTSKNPSYGIIYTTPNVIQQDNKPASIKPHLSSPKPSQSTSQAIEAFNRYPTDPDEFGQTVTTFTYVSSSTTKPTPTTRKPPSTSYVSVVKPSRKPVTYSTNTDSTYDIAPDSFSSATPTVILLNNLQTTKPDSSEDKEPEFVEISQEPFKKPISQITVNNHIESTNNIFMGKPPQTFERPASPTVVITPKPSPNTTPYPIKSSTRPTSISTIDVSNFDTYTEFYSTSTLKPELQTPADDLNNFPPVRNPMLNTTGSNTIVFDTNVADNELDSLHEVEFTTPTWHEDDKLNEKMNLFVNKIVGSLQGTFQELHDIVILDKKPNTTIIKNTKTTTLKPTRKTPATTRRPTTTTKKPSRITTTRKTPIKTTKKPTKLTTAVRRPTTTTTLPTTTKKSVTTTKKPKPTKKATTTTVTPSTTTELYDEITTESYTEQIVNYNDKNLCGVRPLVKSGRIVGGKNASFGEWPWQVLIRESSWLGLFTKNKCGGVLITNRFVTTAAHCQPGFMGSLVAVFGENDISTNLEPRRPVSKNVRRIIPHPKYDAATFENDLALLELDSPIKYEPHIVPICMPPDDADFTNRMATVTGWGRLKYGGGVPAILQEVQVPVMENSHCQYMFQTAGHAKKILDSFICAGYSNGKKDSCEGDSGGPLVVRNDDGRWVLVGTVSHGIKCAARFLPGVYMRTTYYKPWFKSITGVK